MTENKAVETLEYIKTFDGMDFGATKIALDMAIQTLAEIQAYRAIGTVEELKSMKENGAFSGIELAQIAAMQMKLKEYQSIGTVEELQEAKAQYDDINAVAEKTAICGLCDFGTAKEAVITEVKRSLDYSLKEYQKIGTIEKCRVAVERMKPKKVTHQGCYDEKGVWHTWNGINGVPYDLCPNCNINLCTDGYFGKDKNKLKHCENCGQAIDWSKEGGAE